MPRGDKSAYTDKQKRKAGYIEESYKKRGMSEKEAEARAWAIVNKIHGGGEKSGDGLLDAHEGADYVGRGVEDGHDKHAATCTVI